MSMIRFEKVDVIFSKQPREALALLDQGLTRDQILKKTGQVVGVENANLDIERGEICVLMGLSGSGKSSLLRCINGLNTVSRGRLLIEHEGAEVDIASCSPATLKAMRTKRIAMVFQKFALMPWLTVAENVGFGLEMQHRPAAERKKLVDEKLELVGLSQWRDKRPDQLSGGMQQRVGLARALAMDADILLMDEPFSALDPLIRQQLQDELLVLQRKLHKTIVFVSHDLDEALKLGSRIAIMKDGRIIQYSKPEEIVLNPADDYVRTFVAHTNPLNVLCGESLMRPLQQCRHEGNEICVDQGRDCWLGLDDNNGVQCARQGGQDLKLQRWAPGDLVANLRREPTLVNVRIAMRDALQIRYQTGHKLVLEDNGQVVGILGDSELYHALLGKNLEKDDNNAAKPVQVQPAELSRVV
ncbi:choline ABC transporter ATP-binding protein [Pseudomonas indica]|uniref:Glycine betaine/proline transport system ATP-binding protein n=1 Tax=Pseudomonas indica TaxID=137658 RepID=A0A1G9M2E2_9PSED|nr:choline ABC transporter ATP-binding protein [Pseudomonas indica]MBU3058726.1 choline ABC transporter ATP-binding protein [Pseudomonas indica]PAU63254.1 choline ABC transporter ATP-binding protein [Pseudomonas indica]SDL68131.1 glycine betaine/proline transport system ATP-binding protein [Pseudomonas indica]